MPYLCDSLEAPSTGGVFVMSPHPAPSEALRKDERRRNRQVYSAEIHLLYTSANLGFGVTAVAVPALGYLQWPAISGSVVLAWSLFMLVVAAARYSLAYRYRRTASS